MFIVIGQIVGALLMINFLIRNIPSGIMSVMKRNCVLPNGKKSRRRKAVEQSALVRYRNALIVLLSIVLIPANILFWISSSNEEWFKFEMADRRMTDILGTSFVKLPGFDVPSEVREVAWVILILWSLFSLFVLYEGYMRSLRDLLEGAKTRAREYRLANLEMLPPGEGFGDQESDPAGPSNDVEKANVS